MSSHLATPFTAKLQSFLGVLSRRSVSDLPELRRDIRAFVDDAFSALHDSSAIGPHHTRQDIEEALLDALHPILYFTLPSDKARNDNFNHKCSSLQWLSGYHLELPGSFCPSSYRNASEQVVAMARFKAPMVKLGCLLNAWRSICCTLAGEPKEAVGADEILPVFVWVLLHSGCTTYVHDLSWIRLGTGLMGDVDGECDYWLTMAECALDFIERMHSGMIKEKEPGEWVRRVAEEDTDRAEESAADQVYETNVQDVFTLLL